MKLFIRYALCPITVGVATQPVNKIHSVELEAFDNHSSEDLGARLCFRRPGGPKLCGPWNSTSGSVGPQTFQVFPPSIQASHRTTAFLEIQFTPRGGLAGSALYRYTVYAY